MPFSVKTECRYSKKLYRSISFCLMGSLYAGLTHESYCLKLDKSSLSPKTAPLLFIPAKGFAASCLPKDFEMFSDNFFHLGEKIIHSKRGRDGEEPFIKGFPCKSLKLVQFGFNFST